MYDRELSLDHEAHCPNIRAPPSRPPAPPFPSHGTKQKAGQAGDIDADTGKFKELQRIVSSYLEGNTSSDARRWCVGCVELSGFFACTRTVPTCGGVSLQHSLLRVLRTAVVVRVGGGCVSRVHFANLVCFQPSTNISNCFRRICRFHVRFEHDAIL